QGFHPVPVLRQRLQLVCREDRCRAAECERPPPQVHQMVRGNRRHVHALRRQTITFISRVCRADGMPRKALMSGGASDPAVTTDARRGRRRWAEPSVTSVLLNWEKG